MIPIWRQPAARAAYIGRPEVTWDLAMKWAHNNRVPLGRSEEEDLAATNAKRRALGLPPFRIVEQRGWVKEKVRVEDPNVGGGRYNERHKPGYGPDRKRR